MKKQTTASEWAQRITSASPQTIDDILGEMLTALIRDAVGIAEARCVASVAGWAGVVTEQNRKYAAICNRVHDHFGEGGLMKRDGFINALRDFAPEAYALALEGGFKTNGQSPVG